MVGQLQFDVLAYRLEHEYGAKVALDRLGFGFARWVKGAGSPRELEDARIPMAVTDVDGHPVALLRDQWELNRVQRDNAKWEFLETAPIAAVQPA